MPMLATCNGPLERCGQNRGGSIEEYDAHGALRVARQWSRDQMAGGAAHGGWCEPTSYRHHSQRLSKNLRMQYLSMSLMTCLVLHTLGEG
eukprot:2482729-Amphidinium_carterae.1